MRSLWKGVLSFGLVTIPVRLYAATESKDVRLRYLHASCVAPVQYRKVCSRPPPLKKAFHTGLYWAPADLLSFPC